MQIYEWKSLSDLVQEIQGRYKRLNNINPLNKSLALDWASFVVKQIGIGMYEPMILYTQIKNNVIEVPNETQMIFSIYLSSPNQKDPLKVDWNTARLYALRYEPNKIKANYLCKDSPCYRSSSRKSFSINKKTIVFNFTNEYVLIDYFALPTDDNGIIMIPDEESTKKAIEYYILTQWVSELALIDKNAINYNEHLRNTELYDHYISQAKSAFLSNDILNGRDFIEGLQSKKLQFKIPR